MSYRVFARKYRPQRFDEVVGQEHITQTLQNAIKTDRLAQAYLFVGPRGVGKTSTARIFAKALNCHEGPIVTPCGVCDACKEIAEGNSLDVLEIDGASNNNVDSIRTLRENAAFAPARGPYKIYLIDEVHMLTTAAFNALLKTLEEPPAHVKFLFATTEAQKLPATITSRCQRFDLRRLSEEQIATHLLHIAKQEKIELTLEAAAALARGADGALRDAESMFDQIISFCGTSINEEDVHHIFGFTPKQVVEQLVTALLTQDISTALALVTEQAHAGKDLTRLLDDLIGFLRDLLIFKVHPTKEEETKRELSNHVSSEKLLLLLEELGEAEGRLRWATDKKLQLDITLIKAAHLLQEVSLTDILDVLGHLRDGKPLPELPKKPPAPTPLKSIPKKAAPPTPLEKKVEETTSSNKIETAPQPSVIKEEAPAQASSEPASELEKKEPVIDDDTAASNASSANPWDTAAASLATESRLKFGWFTTGKFLERQGNKIIVEFPPSCEAQTETLFWPQARKKIQDCLSKNLGEKIELVCQFTGEEIPEEEHDEPPLQEEPLFQKPVKKEAPKKETSSTATSPAAETSPVLPTLTPEALENFKNDPLIQKALEIFKAEIM